MQMTREELKARVEKDLGVEDVSFAQLQRSFFNERRLRANVPVEVTDKQYETGLADLASSLGVELPKEKSEGKKKSRSKGATSEASAAGSTSTNIEHVQQPRRFLPGSSGSSRPTKDDLQVLEDLEKELNRYWDHVEANPKYRPKLTKREDKWYYPDPMIPGEEIEIGADAQREYAKDTSLDYIDRSPKWIRRLTRMLGKLSMVHTHCIRCEEELDMRLRAKVHALLDKKYRLPNAPNPPGVKGRVEVIKFKTQHDECRLMYPEYVEVLTQLQHELAALKAMPKGKEKRERSEELKATFRERAKLVYRNAAEKLQEQIRANTPPGKTPEKVDQKKVRARAAAIVTLIEEDM